LRVSYPSPDRATRPQADSAGQRATLAYVAPFLAFLAFMAVERAIALPPQWFYLLRFFAVLSIIAFISWPFLSFRAAFPLPSMGIGIAVFLIWIGPDVLFGYRHHWLFDNPITGAAASSAAPALKRNVAFVLLRVLTSTALVPILEELFWRGWLMRWLIGKNFLKVPLGAYAPAAFWIVAVLFASEHGPYWEVGLAAGVIYNWWIIHTRNLADCMLAHAVTNALLSVYVLTTGQWQYWL
jgi:CAAX prenyl protease-like protein